ncbi:MAG: gamma-glutamyltransferase, partial [Terriglobia bacterium]
MRFPLTIGSATLTLLVAVSAAGVPGEPSVARAQGGMVVADEALAAAAGVEILRRGGNAVDAAVAVAFALAVTHPAAGNIGGGGFMLVRMANGGAFLVDYREAAPLAASREMYLDADGNLAAERSTLGWLAAGVPGTVEGLELALRAFGTMSLAEVLAPAIRLAEKGFPVSERLARELREAAPRLERFSESRKIFLRKGRFYRPGEIFKQKKLAKTLKKIARKGAREFYEGEIARRLVKEMRRHGGLMTAQDLRRYRAR